MACCCSSVSQCSECCSTFPSEIQMQLSSNTVTICHACEIPAPPLGFTTCAHEADFSANGTYTLTRVFPTTAGFCADYFYNTCVAGRRVRLVASSLIAGGQCVWRVAVQVINRSATNNTSSSATGCRDCGGTQGYLASVNFSNVTAPLISGTHCDGVAEVVLSSSVGFDGGTCGGDRICGPINTCFSNANIVASDCEPATIDITATLTI